MPKLKTHKASAKRFKKRGSGSIKRGTAFRTHLLGARSTKRKRQYRRSATLDSANAELVRRAIGLK